MITFSLHNFVAYKTQEIMKRLIQLTLALSISVFACTAASAQKITNHPLPQQPDTLRILGIGNSFTDDGMMYLPDLLEAAGIKNVVLGRMYIGRCSLERHCVEYENNTEAYRYNKSRGNRWMKVSDGVSLTNGIEDEDWDIIVLQQSSPKSGNYTTYQPWLDRLTEIVRWHCTNAGASIVWQQTWAFATTSEHKEFPRYENDQQLMFDSIIAATTDMIEDTSIEIIIPSGTAIQNMRQTEFNDSLELTRDGHHLSHTAGRYTAACTWFQALIAPVFKTTVAGNTCTLKGTKNEISPELAGACQKAARRACIRPLEIWKEDSGSSPE